MYNTDMPSRAETTPVQQKLIRSTIILRHRCNDWWLLVTPGHARRIAMGTEQV